MATPIPRRRLLASLGLSERVLGATPSARAAAARLTAVLDDLNAEIRSKIALRETLVAAINELQAAPRRPARRKVHSA